MTSLPGPPPSHQRRTRMDPAVLPFPWRRGLDNSVPQSSWLGKVRCAQGRAGPEHGGPGAQSAPSRATEWGSRPGCSCRKQSASGTPIRVSCFPKGPESGPHLNMQLNRPSGHQGRACDCGDRASVTTSAQPEPHRSNDDAGLPAACIYCGLPGQSS